MEPEQQERMLRKSLELFISLDFDDTYSKDFETWDKIINIFLKQGHTISIVTYRDPGIPINYNSYNLPVYYTSYKAKREYMESKGIKIDVWIDDSPETIIGSSTWTHEERNEWKIKNGFKPDPIPELVI